MTRLFRHVEKERVSLRGHPLHLKCTQGLAELATNTTASLSSLREIFWDLLKDENFVTLLRAESLISFPACLRPHKTRKVNCNAGD
jgi:hypothetical protein